MPEKIVISNTSPLLYLHQVGCLGLLEQLYGTVIAPSAVVRELQVGKLQGVEVPDVQAIAWIQIRPVAPVTLISTAIDLGRGETEVIALGLDNPADSLLILDDRLARRIANLYKLQNTGTLGVLVKAKQSGYISSVAPIIAMLRDRGMWLSEQVINDVMELSGE